jgi:DNA-binding HxlR family transcriptional regulator
MTGRSYQQFCGLAKALDIVGERWTLLIVRELLLCPRRYTDLMSLLPGMTTNLLAKRLQEMQEVGLLAKSERGDYRLTEDGRELEPAIMALASWGARWMQGPSAGDTKNIGWAMLSLKRRFQGTTVQCVVEMRSGERRFQYALSPGGVGLVEGGERLADVTLSAAFEPFAAWFFRGASLASLESGQQISIAGDRGKLPLFGGAFGLRA